jgi:hypothetical protein
VSEWRRLEDYLQGSPEEKTNLLKVLRGIGLGLLGGTAMIHAGSHFRAMAKWTETESFDRHHPEYEQFAMCITGILVIMIEPFAYLVLLSDALNDHGIKGLLWLMPVAVPQAVSWMVRHYRRIRARGPSVS